MTFTQKWIFNGSDTRAFVRKTVVSERNERETEQRKIDGFINLKNES
jgi:hypothetical protein